MKKLGIEKRTQILTALIEGNSIRSTARMCDVAINTVVKLLLDAGKACAEYQDIHLRGLNCKRLQLDEIWTFCYSKQKNVPEEKKGVFGYGDIWTWTAIDADSKLVPCWLVSTRDAGAATEFVHDLRSRLANRVQITTDGLKAYVNAVEDAFGADVDYAMLIKLFGADPEGARRYSPAECIGSREQIIQGNPESKHISTSYAERQNLTMRQHMKRYTRLSLGFSKKLANHNAAVALHFMAYNFVKVHRTLRMSPAMAAGVTKHLWSMEEVAALVP